MRDPRDRLLESSLEELLDESPPLDLAARVREALERGERGTGVDDVPTAAPVAETPTLERAGGVPRPERDLRLWPFAAAAAFLLAAGALTWKWSRPDEPHWDASRHVRVVRADRWESDFSRRVLPGDAVVTDDEAPVVLSMPMGAELTLSPSTVVALAPRDAEDPALDLRLGTAVFTAPADSGLAITTGFARAELGPGAQVRASVQFDFTAREEQRDDLEEWARGRLEPRDMPPRVLTLDVLAGKLRLDVEGKDAVARAGERRELASHPMKKEEIERTDELYMSMTRAGLIALANKGPREYGADRTIPKLADFIAVRHQRRTAVEGWIRELFATEGEDTTILRRSLEFLAYDSSPRALQLVRELWLERPDAFEIDTIVAFAERGAFEFHRELVAMVELHEPGDPELPVLPAAYLGLRGWSDGLEILEEALERHTQDGEVTLWGLSRVLPAAAALEALGYPEAWTRVFRALDRTVEAALARDEPGAAQWVVLTTESFLRGQDPTATRSVSFLAPRAGWHFEERKGEVSEPHQLRELLRDLGSS